MSWKVKELGTYRDAVGLHRKWLVLGEDGCGYDLGPEESLAAVCEELGLELEEL